MAELPNLPTVAESGVAGYKWIFWYGLLAPAKTPRAIVDKLQADVAAVLKQAQVQQRFAPLGIEPVTSSPEAFDQLVRDEVQMFKKLALAYAIKAD
jgi:tripartite-type tricarboxylate transporter receptor subunit TctC